MRPNLGRLDERGQNPQQPDPMPELSQNWRSMGFGLDPWSLEYEDAVRFDGAEESSQLNFSIEVVVETDDWAPIPPDPHTALPASIAFVDGTRHIDTRLTAIEADGEPAFGAFCSIGVGAVRFDGTRAGARFLENRTTRVLGFTRDVKADRVAIAPRAGGRCHLVYEPLAPTGKPEKLSLDSALQRHMRKLEAVLSEELFAQDEPLVVRDGPLLFSTLPGVLGYAKTLGRMYLGPEHLPILFALTPGERTPIFLLTTDYGSPRWVWYLRSSLLPVTRRNVLDHKLVGVVRLELDAKVGLERAKLIARQSALFVPRLASQAHKDPRAPQNLVPVGALEDALKRRMGDRGLLRRHVEHYLISHFESLPV